jgi:hypothetical protein
MRRLLLWHRHAAACSTWTVPGGYHAFSADHGTWSAISSDGTVLTGDTPDALNRKIQAHWQAMQ